MDLRRRVVELKRLAQSWKREIRWFISSRFGAFSSDEVWRQQGIDPDLRFESLLFSPTTEVLIGHFKREKVGVLYARRKDEERYRLLTPADDSVSWMTPVCPSNAPVVYCTVIEWSQIGGYWSSVSAINLECGTTTEVITKHDLAVPAPYEEYWVSRLLSVNDQGTELYCVIGVKGPASELPQYGLLPAGSGEFTELVHYWVCRVSLPDKSFERLALLKNSFF